MNVLRWCVFIAAAIVLLFVYGIWKQLDAKYGGGFVSGFLRGLIILAPLYFLWGWAKDKKGINRLNPPGEASKKESVHHNKKKQEHKHKKDLLSKVSDFLIDQDEIARGKDRKIQEREREIFGNMESDDDRVNVTLSNKGRKEHSS